jgi:PBP1b-binding outer membrane lipoprotein LpoB
MVRFKSSILLVVLTVLIGCSAHREPPQEQEPNRVEQKEKQKPSSVPTFRYRPGAGLMIEGR